MPSEGIKLSEQTKDVTSLAHFREALATLAFWRGEAERSAVLLGTAEGLPREVGAAVNDYYNPDPYLQPVPRI
jgi:hypothetical protein